MDGVGVIGGVPADGLAGGEGEPENARSRKRDSLLLSARMRVADRSVVHDVRVRNLSAGGLMAELDEAVQPGTPVHLGMRGLGALTGRVAWCTRGRIGVTLDQPIDPARARKPVGRGATTPAFAKPLVVPARRR